MNENYQANIPMKQDHRLHFEMMFSNLTGLRLFSGMIAREEIDITGNFLYINSEDELKAGEITVPVTTVQKGTLE